MKPNKFFIFLGVLVILATAFYFLTTNRSGDEVLIGVVDANNVVVSSRIMGRIERLAVDEGTPVKQGDLIAVIDSGELQAQKAAAETTIASYRARVSQARAGATQAEGETASQLTTAQARLQAARSAYAQSQADLDRVKSDATRLIELAKQGVASKADQERSDAQLKMAQAAVQNASDQIRAAESDVKTYQARLEQAKAAQSTLAGSQEDVKTAEAQLTEAETRLGYTQVVAPVTGVVNVRAAREGEVVNPGQAIVTVVDYGDTWVYAPLPETDSGGINLGDTLTVRYPWNATEQGKVIYKAAEADFATQRDVSRTKRDIKTIAIKVRVQNNQQGKLVPGMTAEVLVPKSKQGGQ
ncbi:secretion protein HlyD [Candidatus Koribacter versatilis Ellin345]|uniref:Secretion protein HlyD n=1 Tax=Koribacter versatilis (strain Ellin345) TaxID=204669 RepID=Q1IHS3_KORVE|nr:efflux RND transporter periplasmic adaptor subunit [Candidatus Koribacter versatilis]ABF43577.1 secretion protein HlyD [Candidatus Koribacter versatilis Ellin345]